MKKETNKEKIERLEKALPIAEQHMALLWINGNQTMAFDLLNQIRQMEKELKEAKENN